VLPHVLHQHLPFQQDKNLKAVAPSTTYGITMPRAVPRAHSSMQEREGTVVIIPLVVSFGSNTFRSSDRKQYLSSLRYSDQTIATTLIPSIHIRDSFYQINSTPSNQSHQRTLKATPSQPSPSSYPSIPSASFHSHKANNTISSSHTYHVSRKSHHIQTLRLHPQTHRPV